MDQACLYVSDFGFSFLAIGGSGEILSGSAICLVLTFDFAIWERVGSGRRGREIRGDRIPEFDPADGSVELGDGKDVMLQKVDGNGSPSVAMSTSALSSSVLRRMCTPDARTVSPPLRR